MTEAQNGGVVKDILKLKPKQELVLEFEMGKYGERRQLARRIIVDHVKDALPGDPLGPSITFLVENEGSMPAGSKPQRWTLKTGEMKGMTLIDPSKQDS